VGTTWRCGRRAGSIESALLPTTTGT